MSYQQRCSRLRRLVRQAGTDACLVTNFVNVSYLTGFTGDDSYLLLTGTDETLITDGRYTVQLKEECPDLDLEVRGPGQSMIKAIQRVVKKRKIHSLAVEATSMTIDLGDRLAGALERVELVPTWGMVEKLRMIKDRTEVEAIRQAVKIAERAYAVICASLGPMWRRMKSSRCSRSLSVLAGISRVPPRSPYIRLRPSGRRVRRRR